MRERLKLFPGFASTFAAGARESLRSLSSMRHNVGPRLLSRLLLFSGCVTIILTMLQLYIEYRRDVSTLESRLEQIGESYLGSLAEGLWTLNENQVRLQLTGILRLPDIRAVEVREASTTGDPFVVQVGEKSSDSSAIFREYPLHYKAEGQDMVIGALQIEATLAGIYRTLFDRASIILLSQAAKTFLVSLFILCIFHYLVTRHLVSIANYVGSYRITEPPPHLRLERRLRQHEDELERVVTAFNSLSDDLQIAYSNLGEANDQLIRDIAGRRRMEGVLRESEARNRRLVEANIIGIFIWDFDGRILEANDAFLAIAGCDREDLAAGRMNWTNMTPPDWRERDAQWIEEHRRTGLRQPIEKEYFRKDGSRVPVLVGAANFGESENQGVAFVLDLTERKRAEEAARRSEAELREVIETVPAMVWTALPDGHVDFVNRRWQEYTGLSHDETLGWNWQEEAPFHPEDLEQYLRNWNASLATGQPFQAEMRIRRASDGEYRWLLENAVPLRDEHGNILKWYGFLIDIEDRKRAEEALLQAQAELAHVARVTTMGALTSSIAHEVNQPLGAIVTNANATLRWLAAQPPNLDEARETLGHIVRDGHQAGEVIGRMRALLKKTATVRALVDLNDLIEDTFALVHGELRRHRILQRTELAPDLPPVAGDRVQLQQVVLNLVMNAIEAMKEVTDRRRDLVIRSWTDASGAVVVAVQDAGTGLEPQTAARVLEPFYTTKAEGLGMGLAICRLIIEAHGGRLWVSANEPRGAVFLFAVPPAQDEPLPPGAPSGASPF